MRDNGLMPYIFGAFRLKPGGTAFAMALLQSHFVWLLLGPNTSWRSQLFPCLAALFERITLLLHPYRHRGMMSTLESVTFVSRVLWHVEWFLRLPWSQQW